MPLRLPAAGPAGVHAPALVDLGAGVEIDVHPVTNRRYAEFVKVSGHRRPTYWEGETFPPLIADHPVVGVDLFDALAFCLWAGADLPTQDEWMCAAGGPGRVHPWGREFDATKCNTKSSRLRGTSPVDAHPDGRSPLGCYDMVGNVWEWTRSPHPVDAESAIVKGGSWYDFPAHTRIDTAFRARMNRPGVTVGFRCVHREAPCEDAFLPQELVAACMRARAQAETERQHLELDGGEESLDDLRSVAGEHIEGIVDAAPGSLGATPEAAGELLEVFDRLDDAVQAEELQEQQEAARPTPVPVIVQRDTVVLPRWAGLLAVSLAACAALLLLIQVWTVGDGFDHPREAARVQTDPVRRAPEPRAAPKAAVPEYLSVEDLVQAQAGGRDGPVRRLLHKALENGFSCQDSGV